MEARLLRIWHCKIFKRGKFHQGRNEIAEDMRVVKIWRLLETPGWRLEHGAASFHELTNPTEGSKNDTD